MKGDVPVTAAANATVAPTADAAANAANAAPQSPPIVWPTHLRLVQVLIVVRVTPPCQAGRPSMAGIGHRR